MDPRVVKVSVARSTLLAFLVSVVTLGIGVIMGYVSLRGSVDSAWISGSTTTPSFATIFATNMSTALLLFSGVVTLGISALFGSLALGGFIGATFTVAAGTVGTATAAGSIGWYAPFEFAGFVVAGAGGFLPILAVMLRSAGESRRAAYMSVLPKAGLFALLSAALLLVAAGVEVLVIGGRG